MNKIFKILLMVLISTNITYAIEEGNIKSFMEIKINKASFILKMTSYQKIKKLKKFFLY